MTIKHYCDGCGVEVRRFARLAVAPKWWGGAVGDVMFKFDLCDSCYEKLRGIVAGVPSNVEECK